MNSEPAFSIGGSVSAVLYAAFLILKASGVGVTDEMTNGINALVAALCAIPAVAGFATRFFVYSPNSVKGIAADHYEAGVPPTEPPPDIPPPADAR